MPNRTLAALLAALGQGGQQYFAYKQADKEREEEKKLREQERYDRLGTTQAQLALEVGRLEQERRRAEEQQKLDQQNLSSAEKQAVAAAFANFLNRAQAAGYTYAGPHPSSWQELQTLTPPSPEELALALAKSRKTLQPVSFGQHYVTLPPTPREMEVSSAQVRLTPEERRIKIANEAMKVFLDAKNDFIGKTLLNPYFEKENLPADKIIAMAEESAKQARREYLKMVGALDLLGESEDELFRSRYKTSPDIQRAPADQSMTPTSNKYYEYLKQSPGSTSSEFHGSSNQPPISDSSKYSLYYKYLRQR